jgi:hypothetical protein
VPDLLVGTTLLELRAEFGAISAESQTIQGSWTHLGQDYRDDLVRIFVDVKDEQAARDFFARYKEVLKSRFQQLEIWITTYPIDVI